MLLIEGSDLVNDWYDPLNTTDLELQSMVRPFWEELLAKIPNINHPSIGSTEDGIQLVWDTIELHFEIEIRDDKHYEWFFRNRRTGKVDGNDFEVGLAPKVWDYLRKFAHGHDNSK